MLILLPIYFPILESAYENILLSFQQVLPKYI